MMQKFSKISSIAACLPQANLDTDLILPARYLLLPDKEGLGKHLFNDLRKTKVGESAFVLDTAPFNTAQILITGPGFGSGSSREHAVWALLDFGIRCVIAPNFGEIFHANCIKNGILPIELDVKDHAILSARAQNKESICVDLEQQNVSVEGHTVYPFQITQHHRNALLNGLDEITAILEQDKADIRAFEKQQRSASPWLYLDSHQLSSFYEHMPTNTKKGRTG